MNAACTRPGRVPPFYGHYSKTNPQTQNQELQNLKTPAVTNENGETYCDICNSYKPKRSHHCSTCGFCVLTMDHHCFFLSTCVGFYNRKSFILSIIYGEIIMVFGLIYNFFWISETVKIMGFFNWLGFITLGFNVIGSLIIG